MALIDDLTEPDPVTVRAAQDGIAKLNLLNSMLEWASWLADQLGFDETMNYLARARHSIKSTVEDVNNPNET